MVERCGECKHMNYISKYKSICDKSDKLIEDPGTVPMFCISEWRTEKCPI